MLVNNFLEQSARRYPGKIALISKEGRFCYRELDELANKIANALLADGLPKGARVAIFLDNSLESVVSLFGVLKAGGIFVMVNPTTKTEKLTHILNDCRVSALFSSARKASLFLESLDQTPSLRNIYLAGGIPTHANLKKTCSLAEILIGDHGVMPEPRTIDVDLASIVYTSGSTGKAKGVMMTHLNMISAADSITTYLSNTADDIILNTLPMSFGYGLYQVLMGFKMGGTVILDSTFAYPYKVIERIRAEKVTGFPIVPTMAAILLQMEDIKKLHFPCLRYLTNAAAALPLSHIRRLREFFPNTKIFSMYGQTECMRVSYLSPGQLDVRPTAVGKAIPNSEAYVVDEQGSRVGPGVIGELVVRGSHIMRGYWEMPEETAKRLRPGPYPGELVLYTGDLFKTDEEGYLYFVGRQDDIIKSRGEKVSPKEIENVLYEMDGVLEVAVVGVPDEILGEAVKALLVLKNNTKMTEKEVLKFCSRHLEDYMVPKYVEFRNELPKTDSGKIDKKTLR